MSPEEMAKALIQHLPVVGNMTQEKSRYWADVAKLLSPAQRHGFSIVADCINHPLAALLFSLEDELKENVQ